MLIQYYDFEKELEKQEDLKGKVIGDNVNTALIYEIFKMVDFVWKRCIDIYSSAHL